MARARVNDSTSRTAAAAAAGFLRRFKTHNIRIIEKKGTGKSAPKEIVYNLPVVFFFFSESTLERVLCNICRHQWHCSDALKNNGNFEERDYLTLYLPASKNENIYSRIMEEKKKSSSLGNRPNRVRRFTRIELDAYNV